MKTIIAVVIAAVIFSATASAAVTSRIIFNGGGIVCMSSSGSMVGCMRSDGNGYVIGIAKNVVMVQKDGRTVFKRYQP